MTPGSGVSRSRAANEGESQAKRARIGGAPQNIETEVRGARVLNDRTVRSVRVSTFFPILLTLPRPPRSRRPRARLRRARSHTPPIFAG